MLMRLTRFRLRTLLCLNCLLVFVLVYLANIAYGFRQERQHVEQLFSSGLLQPVAAPAFTPTRLQPQPLVIM